MPSSLKILLKGQLAYMNQFYNVVGVSSTGPALQEVADQECIRVHGIYMTRRLTPLQDLISLIKLCWFLFKEKPEIIHSHTPKAGTLGMIAGKICRVPIRMHTVAGLPLVEEKGIKRGLLNIVEKITYACATKVYPNSFGLKDIILKNRYCSPEKLKVIANGSSNGINTDLFDPDLISDNEVQKIRENLGLKSEDFIYIYIGRIVKDKGVNELSQAFQALCEKHHKIKLMLLGNFEDDLDPLTPSTKRYLQTSDKVILAGYQNDIRPFLKLADVLLHPSYREGFPNVVMQACAFNKPAIVTDINGSNEIIENGINGLVVPVANEFKLQESMELLYLNNELLQKFSGKNRQIMEQKYAQSYVWAEILNEYGRVMTS